MTAPTKTTTPVGATAERPEAQQMAEQLIALATAGTRVCDVHGAYFVTMPPGYHHFDVTAAVEKAQVQANRKHGTVQLKSVASLLLYCKDQDASEQAYIYADPDARKITAVFNDQRRAKYAGWRDHRAVFTAEHTQEFTNWMASNGAGKAMDQMRFAEFIEDNLADITEPSAQALLDVATTISAKTEISFGSARRLDNGQVQLQYTEAINATAGAGGALQIPREFHLGLRIFKNSVGYKLRARLKYRLNSGTVKFWYELDRPERAVEDAFAGYVDGVREHSGYTVLLGAP